jgi:hypothetical protein
VWKYDTWPTNKGNSDATFISLVIHFTEPAKTLAEMRRLLKHRRTLIISNLDPGALSGVDRVHCQIRILYHGSPATG